MRRAYMLFRLEILPFAEDQRRENMYVVRHFPDPPEIDYWARTDVKTKQLWPELRQWLTPEVQS